MGNFVFCITIHTYITSCYLEEARQNNVLHST